MQPAKLVDLVLVLSANFDLIATSCSLIFFRELFNNQFRAFVSVNTTYHSSIHTVLIWIGNWTFGRRFMERL